MEISNATVGAIAALCVTAGAAGVYVATGDRQSSPLETAVVAATPGVGPGVHPFAASAPQPVAVAAPAPRAQRTNAVPRLVATTREPQRQAPQAWDTAPAAEPEPVQERFSIGSPGVDAMAGAREGAHRVMPAQESRVASAPEFIELTIPADSVLGLQIESALTSETAELEDDVVARVTRDVRAGGRVVIPSGSLVSGEVTLVERGGRVRERARLGVRFTSAALPDGTRIPLMTDTVVREGSSPGGESAAKIGGGAIGGAIIGGILGGTRGAVIGGSVGAGAGTTAVMAGGRNAATLPAGTAVSVRLTEPSTVTVDY